MKTEETIAHLNTLAQSKGWQIIVNELKRDIELTERKLFGLTPLADGETILELQRQRLDRVELMNLPASLVQELEKSDTKPDLDPYD